MPMQRKISATADHFSKLDVRELFNCKIVVIRICVSIKPSWKSLHKTSIQNTLFFLFFCFCCFVFFLTWTKISLKCVYLTKIVLETVSDDFSSCYFKFYLFSFGLIKKKKRKFVNRDTANLSQSHFIM